MDTQLKKTVKIPIETKTKDIIYNAYKQSENNSEIMIFEKRHASGLNNLEGLVFAIKNSKIITFNYTKNWEGIPHKR